MPEHKTCICHTAVITFSSHTPQATGYSPQMHTIFLSVCTGCSLLSPAAGSIIPRNPDHGSLTNCKQSGGAGLERTAPSAQLVAGQPCTISLFLVRFTVALSPRVQEDLDTVSACQLHKRAALHSHLVPSDPVCLLHCWLPNTLCSRTQFWRQPEGPKVEHTPTTIPNELQNLPVCPVHNFSALPLMQQGGRGLGGA